MKPEKKTEKIVGYILLVIGLVFIIIPALLAFSMFLSGAQIPQFVPVPTGEQDGFARAFATFSNVCLIFFIFIIIVWAGSIISSRGVALIKEIKLKVARESLSKEMEVVEKEKAEKP